MRPLTAEVEATAEDAAAMGRWFDDGGQNWPVPEEEADW